MKRKFFLLLATLPLFLTACNKDTKKVVHVTNFNLSQETAEIVVGGGIQLYSIIDPANADDKQLIWSSTNEDIARVEDGLVTGYGVGTCEISVIPHDTEELKDALPKVCAVTVKSSARDPKHVTSVNVAPNTASLNYSDTLQLSLTVLPADADDKTVVWSSDDEEVATVDQTGLVTCHAGGAAVIYATANDGGIFGYCTITVAGPVVPVAVTGVTVKPETAEIDVNSTVKLTATVAPWNASNKNVTWSSDNENVTVSSEGQVTGVSVGTSVVTATTVDGGFTDTCTVTVSQDISNNYYLTIGQDKVVIPVNSGFSPLPGQVGEYMVEGLTFDKDTNISFDKGHNKLTNVYLDESHANAYNAAPSDATPNYFTRVACDGDGKVVLKLWDSGDYTFYVSGFTCQEGFTLMGSKVGWHGYGEPLGSPDTEGQYILTRHFDVDEEVKMLNYYKDGEGKWVDEWFNVGETPDIDFNTQVSQRTEGGNLKITVAGDYTLYLTMNGKAWLAPAQVVVKSLDVTGTPNKTTYDLKDGNTFDPTGLVITATYSDDSQEDVTTKVSWPALTEGMTSITGTYGTKTVVINGLTVTDTRTGVTYTVSGANFDLDIDGAVIFAHVCSEGGLLETVSGDIQSDKRTVTVTTKYTSEVHHITLARCIAGSTEPDWNAPLNAKGRVYNKTEDITITQGTTSYAATWSEYTPVNPNLEAEVTVKFKWSVDWIYNDDAIVFVGSYNDKDQVTWYKLPAPAAKTDKFAVWTFKFGLGRKIQFVRCSPGTTTPEWNVNIWNSTDDIFFTANPAEEFDIAWR